MNDIPPNAMIPIATMTRLPPIELREARTPNGISGSIERDSTHQKIAPKQAAPASAPHVAGWAHPFAGACTTA